MSKTTYEYLLQRKKEGRSDLYETVSSRGRIILGTTIDVIVFLAGVALITIFGLNAEFDLFGFVGIFLVLYIFGYYLIKIVFNGTSLGFFLAGLRMINIKTKYQVTKKEYTEYLLQNITSELKPNKVLKHYFDFDNRYSQNKVMMRHNFVAVHSKKYKQFLVEYQDILRQIEEYEKLNPQNVQNKTLHTTKA